MGSLRSLLYLMYSMCSAFLEKGLVFWLSWFFSYIYLSIFRLIYGRRFDLYDFFDDGSPEKMAFFVPREEWDLDAPQTNKNRLNKKADDVFCFGVNLKSEGIAVHISRQLNGKVRCSLFLRLSNGREYVLPEEHGIQLETNEEFTFGSARLKLQCLQPMRKWRIFFNGIMRLCPNEDNSLPLYQHVKFSLIFTASSGIFDFSTDMSNSFLAEEASLSAKLKIFTLFVLQRIRSIFDCYEQSGMILGTIQTEGEQEREIYLWGSRGRYRGKTEILKNGRLMEIYGNFENGAVLHLGLLNLQGVLPRFRYGYVMKPDGCMNPIKSSSLSDTDELNFAVTCSDSVKYEITVKFVHLEGLKFQKEFCGEYSIKYAEITLNDAKGSGFVLNGVIKQHPKEIRATFLETIKRKKEVPLTITFEEPECQNVELTGGKGSSLSKLHHISKRGRMKPTKFLFQVPKGIVVTTEAYKIFTKGKLNSSLQVFQKSIWSNNDGDIAEMCQKMVQQMSSSIVPSTIIESIKKCLTQAFGNDLKLKKFAVRSSAIGEDTAQMSAAGQLKTFLGLRGTNEILQALKKCWASQFALEAVQYKRHRGQFLVVPMAVVIQEMIPCDVAGVAFTCDPLTGNPSFINITANEGLGESVVSASVEPDTIILKRSISSKIVFHSETIGSKQKKIVMKKHSGVEEVDVDDESALLCCLGQDLAVKLGQLLAKIEDCYGFPLDIEWGMVKDKIFLFQARAITSLDVDTDFESKHVFDTYLRAEYEYLTRANVGEVMPGALSPLGLDLCGKIGNVSYPRQRCFRLDEAFMPGIPFFHKGFIVQYNNAFMCVIGAFLKGHPGDPEAIQSTMLSIFGQITINDEIFQKSLERYKNSPKRDMKSLYVIVYSILTMFLSGIFNKRLCKGLEHFEVPYRPGHSATQILNSIAHSLVYPAELLYSHVMCSISSSFWNMAAIIPLVKAAGGWSNEVHSDFAFLLSTCKQIESADVPEAIENLGCTIANSPEAEKFRQMDLKDALQWLLNSGSEAGKQFRSFLAKHGHRCLKEFDMYSTTWGQDPKPLIKILQEFPKTKVHKTERKEQISNSDILSNIHVELNLFSRLLLRLVLPNCRRAVREREYSKAMYVNCLHRLREPFHRLAEVMVQDGYLPNKELMFFLCVEEVKQLIKTRSPRLVSRAFRRWKCHGELDKLIFPVLSSGIPKPINTESAHTSTSEDLTMKGIPISQGTVKATARVVIHLNDATCIQPGDILITYSTDIGWTPYFPLLSGIVTELGGLISHGAVVAREYGLPCIVGLDGATQAFKSGDQVVLDANKGLLRRVERS